MSDEPTLTLSLPEKESLYFVTVKDADGWRLIYFGLDKAQYRKALDQNKGKYLRTNGYVNPNPVEYSSKLVIGVASDEEIKASRARMEAIEEQRKRDAGITVEEATEVKEAREKAVRKALDVVEKPNKTRIGTMEVKDIVHGHDVNAEAKKLVTPAANVKPVKV